jgi:hypothetical protein
MGGNPEQAKSQNGQPANIHSAQNLIRVGGMSMGRASGGTTIKSRPASNKFCADRPRLFRSSWFR